ncbi:MAG: hypothetical protein Ct9H300mP11_16250 [Chloroflexota bacterium]|nr:MAG: hypothetical protein Ct9H300mP11_16250 [Chloroflexota bacterium]
METPTSNRLPPIWNDGVLVDLWEILSEPSLILWCGLEPEKKVLPYQISSLSCGFRRSFEFARKAADIMTWIYNASVVMLGGRDDGNRSAGFAGLRAQRAVAKKVLLPLCVLPGAKSGGPGPLEVITAQRPGNVHRFPGKEQAGCLHRLHRLGREAGGVHAAQRHLRLAVTFRPPWRYGQSFSADAMESSELSGSLFMGWLLRAVPPIGVSHIALTKFRGSKDERTVASSAWAWPAVVLLNVKLGQSEVVGPPAQVRHHSNVRRSGVWQGRSCPSG